MILGYNTNGFAHHELTNAIKILASQGYRALALTLDHNALNPFSDRLYQQIDQIVESIQRHELSVVVETGARYLLDPRVKHEPTLVSADPERRKVRVDFYRAAINVAHRLDAGIISLWSGVLHDNATFAEGMARLVPALSETLRGAAESDVTVAFEPEPGMLIDTLDRYAELKQRLFDAGADLAPLRLTIDIGHLHCNGETPIEEKLRYWREEIANLHIEDMRFGEHEHLQFGEGEIDFPPLIATLKEIAYDGPLTVELSRHSHQAPEAAQRAIDFLAPLIGS